MRRTTQAAGAVHYATVRAQETGKPQVVYQDRQGLRVATLSQHNRKEALEIVHP